MFPCVHYTDQSVCVESVEYERTDDFYDLHVPDSEQYFLSGVLHHNSGKSTISCLKWVSLCMTYPGVRIFACRKHRASCTESMLPIFDAIIPPHELKNPRLQRTGRHSYDFVNGSTIVIGGLDQVTKTLSTQFSVVYVQEATEITENDWEFLQRPLRDPVVPHPDGPYTNGQLRYWTQAVAECNPDAPTHWLNRRANEGKMRRILSRHEDNPTVTEDYLKKLRALTGVRRSRLYEGKWVAAEGQIWPEFDQNIHVLTRLPNREQWRYFGAIDWGFRAPGCMQVWAVDKFNWMYRVAEVYQAERTDDWWLETAQKLRGEFDVEYWVADPEDAGAIAKFRRAGLSVVLADKNIEYGLDAVRQRLAISPDTGMPRMFFLDIVKARRRGVCPICTENRWPTCFEDEVGAYTYTTIDTDKAIKEVPDPKCFDHAADTTRYATVHMDPRDMRPKKPVPKFHPNSFAVIEGYEEIMRKSRAGEYDARLLEREDQWG